MDCSMPSFPVHHQLPELAQTHVHWCHPIIASSVIPFSSFPQSFPALGSFPVSQFFTSGGQSIAVSASASGLPMNIQDWFHLGWNYKMHCKFYPFLYSVLKYQKSLLTFLPIFTTAASNSIFHGAARLIFPSFLLSLSPFFFSYFCLIFSLILLSFFIKCIRNLITSLV